MSNVAIDLTKTVKEIITTMKTAIDNLNTNVDSLKSEILLAAHPVGSYYISDNATDPGTLFGGTWKMLDPGLALISQGKGTDKFGSFEFVAGQTYGERMHQLTVEELANVTGTLQFRRTLESYNIVETLSGSLKYTRTAGPTWRSCLATSTTTSDVVTDLVCMQFGGDQPHNNLQPAHACYIWFRTA